MFDNLVYRLIRIRHLGEEVEFLHPDGFDPTRELNGVFIESLATAWALFPQARVDMFAVTAAGHRHVLDAFGCY